MVIIVGFWVLCGILGYLIGQSKGRGDEGAVAGLLLGPIGLVFILVAGDRRPHCPYCRGIVDATASICPHCQHQIAPAPNALCPNCHKGFRVSPAALGHVVRCPHCNKKVPAKAPDVSATAPVGGRPERAPSTRRTEPTDRRPSSL